MSSRALTTAEKWETTTRARRHETVTWILNHVNNKDQVLEHWPPLERDRATRLLEVLWSRAQTHELTDQEARTYLVLNSCPRLNFLHLLRTWALILLRTGSETTETGTSLLVSFQTDGTAPEISCLSL